MERAVVLLSAALLLSGCVQTGAELTGSTVEPAHERPIVVAILDTGINPYHPMFSATSGASLDAGTPVTLSTEGNYSQRVEADTAHWDDIARGQLYRYEGTRIAAISFADEPTILPGWDTHGVTVSYLLAREAPEVYIVAIQVQMTFCTTYVDCGIHPTIADGMEWAAAQPWIDVISVSVGIPANPPDRPELHEEMGRYVAASRLAVASGKLVVTGAGNTVAPGFPAYLSGPPWVVAAGGVNPDTRGEALLAGKLIDVASDFTALLPPADSVGEEAPPEPHEGTSLATPIVAATLARAKALARDAGHEATPQELRDALNASATYYAPTDWKPAGIPASVQGVLSASLPVVVQPQMGWGYVNGSYAPEIARRVVEQDFSIPPGKEQAMLFQPAWQKGREEFWSRYMPER